MRSAMVCSVDELADGRLSAIGAVTSAARGGTLLVRAMGSVDLGSPRSTARAASRRAAVQWAESECMALQEGQQDTETDED